MIKLNKQNVQEILENTNFKFAKTMKNIPHSYTLKENWENKNLFHDIVLFIREHGVQEKFYKKTYTYLYLNGYKYWTMGFHPKITRLINKAKA
tara:strand:- start:51 stop:329 length:279 start_codon:yes stop_codon:yes gene_type:complete